MFIGKPPCYNSKNELLSGFNYSTGLFCYLSISGQNLKNRVSSHNI